MVAVNWKANLDDNQNLPNVVTNYLGAFLEVY